MVGLWTDAMCAIGVEVHGAFPQQLFETLLTAALGSRPPGSYCRRWPSEMLTAMRSHQGSSTLHTSASGDIPQPLQAEYAFQ